MSKLGGSISGTVKKLIPPQVLKDVASVEESASIGPNLIQDVDTSTLPEGLQLYIELHEAEDAFVTAFAEATKINVTDILLQELLTGHIDVAVAERQAVLEVRARCEAFVKANL